MTKQISEEEKNCIFCKIIEGKIPVVKLWEDEKYFIFLDSSPINPGHTLVLPKKHTDYIFDLNDKEYSELMLKAKEVAKILKKKLNPDRVCVIIEGFAVPHVHIHLVPLKKGDELNFEKAKPMDVKELNKIKEKIIK
jgi:histidine triad (HIT) family protein